MRHHLFVAAINMEEFLQFLHEFQQVIDCINLVSRLML